MTTMLAGAAMGRAMVSRAIALIPTPSPDVDPSTGKGPEWGKAAPIGLLVILLLCASMFFLMRSMNRKIKAVPPSFDAPGETTTDGSAGPSADLVTADEVDADPAQPAQESTDPPAQPGATGLVNDRTV